MAVEVQRARPGEHVAAAPAGRRRRAGRRPGRRSGATARRSGRRTRPAPRPPGVPARPAARMPLRRGSRAAGSGWPKPGRAASVSASTSKCGHLAARVHAGVGAAGADDGDRRQPQHGRQRGLQRHPGRSAAPAAQPSRGSRCRRRRGRCGSACRAHPLRVSGSGEWCVRRVRAGPRHGDRGGADRSAPGRPRTAGLVEGRAGSTCASQQARRSGRRRRCRRRRWCRPPSPGSTATSTRAARARTSTRPRPLGSRRPRRATLQKCRRGVLQAAPG